jgi:hypothetical protein
MNDKNTILTMCILSSLSNNNKWECQNINLLPMKSFIFWNTTPCSLLKVK